MSEYVFKLPDLGEGTVESEIGEWFINVGDKVMEEDVVGTMMTDKAAIEVSSPVSGTVIELGGKPGDIIAVGAPLITFETENDVAATTADGSGTATPAGQRVKTSPAIRRRAKEAGIDLRDVPATGPGGRVTRTDFDAFLESGTEARGSRDRGKSPPGPHARMPGRKKSRSSACAASSPSDWHRQPGKFRTSPMSRKLISPKSRHCGGI
jgi:2-oxoisovalerate dehydrogenase E2 component (dihydrolipoyl transacylase)